jgi:PAS domain S-box-containing protein
MIHIAPQLKILVVEDNLGDYILFEEYLHDTGLDVKDVQNVISVAEAKKILAQQDFDLVFLDLSLPDSVGIQSLIDLNHIIAHIPIVVLSGMEETQTTTQAIINGAQDYLIKGELDAKLLSKTIRYSIERKKNLEKIKQSNERYTLVSNATIGMVWDINLITREVVRSGDAFLQQHGYDEHEFTSNFDFWGLRVHPDDYLELNQRINQHLEKAETKFWESEYRFQNGNGEYFYVHDRGSTIFGADGQPARMIGTMMDISERKTSEELLRISEHNYRQIFFNNPNPMWIYDAETLAFLEVNPAAIKHYGYTREEFLSITLSDVRPEEDATIFFTQELITQQIAGAKEVFVVHQKKNREKIIVEITAYPIDFGGKQAMQTLINDVTEKVRNQKEKQVVVQAIESFRNASSLTIGLNESLKCIRDFAGWEYGEIWLSDYHQEHIRLQTFDSSSSFPELTAMAMSIIEQNIPFKESIYQIVEKQKFAFWSNNVQIEPYFIRKAQAKNLDIKAAVSVPIMYNEKIIGWILLFSQQTGNPDIKIINFLESVCKQLGSEIEKRNADEQLNHFFMLSSDLLGIATLDGYFVRVNNSFSRILGYQENTINGSLLLDYVHPEDKEETHRVVKGLAEKQAVSFMENRFIAQNGDTKWVSWSVTFLPDEKLVFASGRDITKQKEEELQLRLLESVITNSNDAIVITEPILSKQNGQKVVYFNKSFLQLTGYNATEIIENPTQLLRGANTNIAELEKINEAMATWTPAEAEVIIYKKTGEEFWTNLSVIPVPDKTGVFTHWISIFRDITARKKGEAEKEILIKELTDSNTDLKQFTFITSHNLRAPLSNLLGILDLIEPSVIQDEMTLFLIEKFKESTLQLNQTVNDLLNVLVIKNKVNLERKTLQFETEFEKVKTSIQYQINEASALLKTDFTAINTVSFDSTYLESILLNLLTNAIKYRSPKRSLELNIFTKDTPEYIELYFMDNGIGIDLKRHHSKIFGLYQRFHDYPESKGLGLYIVSSQIRALGGKIEVQSEVDKGTTFVVYFAK